MQKKKLGKTDIFVTPIGMGTLTMGFSQKNLSVEDGAALIVYAVRRGINFLDTAQYYDTYRYIRPALDIIKQDMETARTKGSDSSLPAHSEPAQSSSAPALPVICSKTLAPDYNGAHKAVLECLRELDLPRIDIFLLHEIRGMADFNARKGAWRALRELREAGKIRAIGISTHHVDACRGMASEKDCDVVFTLINRAGLGIRDSGITSEEENARMPLSLKNNCPGTREAMEDAILDCDRTGVGVFTMKAFGGGNLIRDYISCLDYASSVKGNTSVMIGMADKTQVDAAVRYFSGKLDPGFIPSTKGKRLMVDQSDCEGCGTCIRRCVSRAIHRNENGLAEIDQARCIHCGYCAPVCPVRAIIFA